MAEKNNSSSLPQTHDRRLSGPLDSKSLLVSQFSAGDRQFDAETAKQRNEPEALNSSSTMAKAAPFFTSLDPRSMILSQFGSDQQPNFLQLMENFEMERGPRYGAYAQLRESRLRMKMSRQYPEEPDPNLSPPKKQVKFQGNFPANTTTLAPVRRKGSSVHSVIAQSVPDLSSMLRKENRRPANTLPPLTEKSLTPPPISRNSKLYGVGTRSGGSKSVNTGEKRVGGVGGSMMARKSYANMEELKGLSAAAASAINGEIRGGRGGRSARTILGYRQ